MTSRKMAKKFFKSRKQKEVFVRFLIIILFGIPMLILTLCLIYHVISLEVYTAVIFSIAVIPSVISLVFPDLFKNKSELEKSKGEQHAPLKLSSNVEEFTPDDEIYDEMIPAQREITRTKKITFEETVTIKEIGKKL